MKKTIALVAAVVFVLGFAASAFAIHAEIPAETQAVVSTGATQITLGGEVRVRGWWRDGLGSAIAPVDPAVAAVVPPAFTTKTARIGLDNDDNVHSYSWYDQRVRLSVDAKVSPNVQAFIQLESEGTGFDNTNDKYYWGTSGGNSGFSNAKPKADPDFLQAWILYTGQGLFGVPAGLKIGHMPLKLAYGQFFDHTQMGDDALVLFVNPTKQMHIAALTIKLAEGAITDNTDDLDAYVGLITYKFSDAITAGINYTYLNSSDFGMSQQDIGVHADGKIGGFGYQAAVDFQFGNLLKDVTNADELKFKGYAATLKANYDLNPVNLRGSFVYGSGEKELGDNDIREFTPYVGNVQNYSFIYEYQHATTAFNKSGLLNPADYSNGHAAGIANTTYVNLGADFKATKDVSLSLDGYYFWASKTGAWEDLTGNDVSKTAGWEIDGKLAYQIAKNLTYQIDAGYFHPGGFYEDAYGVDTKGVTVLRHLIQLTF